MGIGIYSEHCLFTASCIIARYGDEDLSQKLEIGYKQASDGVADSIEALPMREENLRALRI